MEYLKNKKAFFDYEVMDSMEAGIELLGTEVKSLKAGHGSMQGSYVSIVNGTVVLLGAHIPPWQEKNAPLEYDPYRTRTLLLHKKERIMLEKALQSKGLTIVPISLYNKSGLIKVQIAIARGKKNVDKRETIKARDTDRELRRTQKNWG